jgi:hypothetical protein
LEDVTLSKPENDTIINESSECEPNMDAPHARLQPEEICKEIESFFGDLDASSKCLMWTTCFNYWVCS